MIRRIFTSPKISSHMVCLKLRNNAPSFVPNSVLFPPKQGPTERSIISNSRLRTSAKYPRQSSIVAAPYARTMTLAAHKSHKWRGDAQQRFLSVMGSKPRSPPSCQPNISACYLAECPVCRVMMPRDG